MYRLIQFLKRFYPALLFVVLEVLAINYYAKSSEYAKAKVLTATNKVAGGLHSVFAYVGDWFSLPGDNRRIMERLAAAETELVLFREAAAACDSLAFPEIAYAFSPAKVVNNTITHKENFFLIDKGIKDGVERNMSVVTVDGGVAGYVEDVSSNFAVCMSVLNRDFRIGGRVKGKDYIGSVFWDGTNTRYVTLSDIPKYAPLAIGDTIVSAYSSRFPPDMVIGTIDELGESPDGTYFQVKVRLATQMARLSDVVLIHYTESQELQQLEDQYFNTGGQNRQ